MKFLKLLTATVLCLSLTGIVHSQEKKIYWGSDVPTGWSGTWPEKLLTPAERSDYTKTASNDEILEFIFMLKWNSENIYVYVTDKLFPSLRQMARESGSIEIFYHAGLDRNWPPKEFTHERAIWSVEGKFIFSRRQRA